MARLIFLRWWAIFWGYQICLGRSVVKFQPLPKVLCDGTDRVTRLIEGWNSTTNLFNGTILCWGWEEGTREGVGWKHDHTTTTDGYGWRWHGGWWLLVIHVLIYEYKSHIQKDAGDAEMAEKAQGSKDTLSILIFETNEMSDWHFHMVQGGTHTQY